MAQDKVVGTMTTVNYQGRFGWVGMVLVDPEFRGHGIGTHLLRLSTELLKEVPAIRLDATPQGRPVYERLGYVAEYELSRMQVEVTAELDLGLERGLRPMNPRDLHNILPMDQSTFGADRGALLDWSLAHAPEYAWVVEGASGLQGYCFGRHGFAFEQVGPIVAHRQETAQHLVTACLQGNVGKRFILDPLHLSSAWLDFLSRTGFVRQRPFTRMFLGENRYPGVPQKQWAIFGPELG